MKPVGVFYATREGQTRKIAEHIASSLRAQGLAADVKDLRRTGGDIILTNYCAAMLAASAHLGRHEKEMIRFVKEHCSTLHTLPTVFISVTLSEAGAERRDATPEQRAEFSAAVQDMLEKFFEQTKWRPSQAKAVAGALPYSKYGLLKRFVMRRIAAKAGAETDASRDYEYTDWAALDQFVSQFAEQFVPTAARP